MWVLLLVMIAAAVALGMLYRRSQAAFEERMKTVFQSLSFEVMERSQRAFLDLAKSTIETAHDGAKANFENQQKTIESMMSPLREAVLSLDLHQRNSEKRHEGAYASLSGQIENMLKMETELRKETVMLSTALRSPPVRGAWGQVHLRRVVELAGLVNHCDFTEQTSHETEGRLLRPDLIIHLPGERHIIVDAKTPLSDCIDTQAADINQMRVKNYAELLRKHMRELSQKDYWKRFDLSPEFVVLYLPAESFLSVALQADPSLIEFGAEQNVILATPTTLISIFRAVAHGWKQEAISKNAEQIALLGCDLYERLSTLLEHWTKVGRSLSNAVDSYNQAVASLESRVLVSARKLKDHGATPMGRELAAADPIDIIPRTVAKNGRAGKAEKSFTQQRARNRLETQNDYSAAD
jgi:DNA recombination protein RmuC